MNKRDLLVGGVALVLAIVALIPWTMGKANERRARRTLSSASGIFETPLLPLLGPHAPRSSDAAVAQAAALAQQALRSYPQLRQARETLAEAHLLSGDRAQAAPALKELASYPAYGQVQQAERMMLYVSYAQLHPEPAQQRVALADLGARGWDLMSASDTYVCVGALEEAELLLKQALVLAPDSGDVWTAWGRFNLKLGRRDPAVEALEYALELEGWEQLGYSTPRFLLGRLYREEGRPQKAIPLLQEAIDRDKFSTNRDRGGAYRQLGLIYREQGDEEKAQEFFRIAAKYTIVEELE